MQTLKEPQLGRNRSGTLSTQFGTDLLIGYALLFASVTAFAITELSLMESKEKIFTIFVLHYIIALVYSGILIFYKSFGIRRSWRKENISKSFVLFLLYLTSAYALNRELPVFQDSATWVCLYLIATSIVLLSFHFYNELPPWVRTMQLIVLGSALVFYCYLAIYVANHYVVGFIGIIFFGIGGHIFVPIAMIGGMIALARYTNKGRNLLWAAGGALATILYCVSFVAEWNNRVTGIDRIVRESVMYPDAALPIWTRLGEVLPNDWITERILKTDLVYSSAKDSDDWFSLPSSSWTETRKHDPFVILGTLTSRTSLSEEDRIKILRSITDARHRSHERFWSGDNLITTNIVTDIDFYSDFHLAYTEKYLDIRNTSVQRSWGNTEEALYTFRMPEGSVVTSLSLWVNGKEEKAILTSKGKATEAYETIVGKEMRDPSVVHWQEGNTILVRVFPCTPTDERKVKIGFTSPLRETEGKLKYENITFEGPSSEEARETIRVRIIGNDADELAGFQRDKNGDWVSENEYDPDFEIEIPATPVKADSPFNFLDNSYRLESYVPILEPAKLQNIFLDVNNTWTNSELAVCQKFIGQKSIYVYHKDAFISLTADNWEIVNELTKRNYSLFPIHRLQNISESIVVTKGTAVSPHLGDLKGSAFASSMNTFFANGSKVRVFNLGDQSSNFIKSLRELRAFNFTSGSIDDLQELVEENKFPVAVESENAVVLHDAALKIIREPLPETTSKSKGPDHLYRLFAYNNIMRQAGPVYFAKEDPKTLVEEAALAYVVSPVSSLIVLETQKDYDRFGIQDIDNSLKNAAKQSSGAVPEPHEWALIILFILVAVYVKFKAYL